MPKVDTMQVCLNGHKITESYESSPHSHKKYCTNCASETIIKCPSCNNKINGRTTYEHIVDLTGSSMQVPNICEHCGKDFPWRELKRKIAKASIEKMPQDDLYLLDTISNNFHLVVKQIRTRYNNRRTLNVKDEYDVQDLFHTLLRLFFEDIRTEEWNPSYAGSASRSDFLLRDQNIVIEIKKTRNTLKAKQLGEQLIIDIAKYKTHPN